jgi:hypothetical protein
MRFSRLRNVFRDFLLGREVLFLQAPDDIADIISVWTRSRAWLLGHIHDEELPYFIQSFERCIK